MRRYSVVDDLDIFLAHAGPERLEATLLAGALRDLGASVFASFDSLKPGDPWDTAIPEAMRRASMTVVLVGPNTSEAWYELEEIAKAIAQQRSERREHRVVPVVIAGLNGRRPEIPYGLGRLHALTIQSPQDRASAARQLVDLVRPPPLSNVRMIKNTGAARWDAAHDAVRDLIRVLPRPDPSFSPAEAATWRARLKRWGAALSEVLRRTRQLAAEVPDLELRRDLRNAISAAHARFTDYYGLVATKHTDLEASESYGVLLNALETLANALGLVRS